MSELGPVTQDQVQPAADGPGETKTLLGSAAPVSSGKQSGPTTGNSSLTYPQPPGYFIEALEDAERLLKYAAEIGIDVGDKTRNSVLEARAAVGRTWNETTIANLLVALTQLATQLKPVTAESLRTFNTRPTVRTYWVVAICLAVLVVPFSVASFVTAAISKSISTDIATANDLAVKLTSQFGAFASQATPDATQPGGAAGPGSPFPAGLSPTDAVTELQTFASQIRAIYARSRQLNWFIFGTVRDPFTDTLRTDGYKKTFQLPVPLPTALAPVVNGRILVFQDARAFGQDAVDDVSVFYGAISTCVLPVLYALLGTCAYLLRSFSQEMTSRTFVPSHSDSARFLIAAIVGGVVGLFNNFTINQAASIPPLAIAFVVGYAVDVFFSFLEGLIQAFTKSKNGSSKGLPAPAPANKP